MATSIDACISAKGAAGIVDVKKANATAREYREMVEEVAADGELDLREAERLVADMFLKDIERASAIRKANAMRQAVIQEEMISAMDEHVARGVPVDVIMRGRLTFDPSSRYTGVSLEARINGVRGLLHEPIVDMLSKYRTKMAGLTGRGSAREHIKLVVKEIFGENTGNAEAKQLAKGVVESMEEGRARFNAAGGHIETREKYGLHQSHDQGKLLETNKDDWVQFTAKLLDRENMRGASGRRMSDRQLARALGDAYDSISTGGATDLTKPRGPSGAGSSVNRRANSRFLTFKDGDAWMDYHDKFGVGDIQDHILSTFSKYARDIAELEVLGPHSEASLRFMQQLEDAAHTKGALSSEGKKARKHAQKIGRDLNGLKTLYDIVTGRAAVPAREGMAKWGQSIRNVLVSNQLGSAFLVAISDVSTIAMTAKMNGMAATRTLSSVFRTFAVDKVGQRETALRLGYAAQGWASHAIGAQRFTGELAAGHAVTEKVADTVLRASLLTPLTEAGRYGFQIEFSGFITSQLGKDYAKLPRRLRESFQRYEIDEAAWKTMQSTAVWKDPTSGAQFLRAMDIYDGARDGIKFDTANKMQQMILTETQFAVVSSTSRVRQLLGEGKFKKGTFWGEVIQTAAMYKSFPMSIMHTHIQRAAHHVDPKVKYGYLPIMMLGMTTMGAIGMQANEIASGKKPRNMYKGRFWADALLKGGALGLMGDVLFQEHAGFGKSLVGFLAGPGGRLAGDVLNLTAGNALNLIQGEDTNVGKELFGFVEGLSPGRRLWYAKLLQERFFFDMVERLADPEAQKAFKRQEDRAREDFDQGFWWKPGRTKPN